MDDMEKMPVERACARLVTEYCHLVDHGDAGKIAGQFIDDGVWTSERVTMSGRDALVKGFARRRGRRELQVGFRKTAAAARSATAAATGPAADRPWSPADRP